MRVETGFLPYINSNGDTPVQLCTIFAYRGNEKYFFHSAHMSSVVASTVCNSTISSLMLSTRFVRLEFGEYLQCSQNYGLGLNVLEVKVQLADYALLSMPLHIM